MTYLVVDREVLLANLEKELTETRAILGDLLQERLPKIYVVLGDTFDVGGTTTIYTKAFLDLDRAKAWAEEQMASFGELDVDDNGLGPEQHDANGRQLPERPPVRVVDTVTWRAINRVGDKPEHRIWISTPYDFKITEYEIESGA